MRFKLEEVVKKTNVKELDNGISRKQTMIARLQPSFTLQQKATNVCTSTVSCEHTPQEGIARCSAMCSGMHVRV